MSFNIGNTSKYPNRAKVWSIEDKGTFGSAKISSSRRDKRLPEGKQWVNTNWFASFVGDAYGKIGELSKGASIEIISGTVSQEPYEKDGEKFYPKAPKVTIFDFSVLGAGEGGNAGFDKPPVVEDSSDENIPF